MRPSSAERIAFRLRALRDRADALVNRRAAARRRLLIDAATGPPSSLSRTGAFDYERARRLYQRPATVEGRLYNYVLYPGDSDILCVHFSAFFGEWGEQREVRAQFAGYFHRLRMFWPVSQYNFLFLCDTFGADDNGTYYKGESGDFFVERAMDEIISGVADRVGSEPSRTVALGSSMGATGAIRFALRHRFAGAVAVSPHIDLDLCARYQGRQRHVAALLGADDVEDPVHFPVTREIRSLVSEVTPLPRLVIQSARDDAGVHAEQVEPLVEQWRSRGGFVRTDFHDTGGHTSDYATPEFFVAAVEECLVPQPEAAAR